MPRPQTPGYNTTNIFIPVPPNPNFPRHPEVDEKTALVMNVVVPQHPRLEGEKFPVLAWIHGGSLLFGSANYGIYDAVNLVSHSVEIGWPVVVASFNYRLGLGGFLASAKIGEELKAEGFEGNGNFGFTDQKVAMDWIQTYISEFGGDPNSVTVFGQSAGGVSIGHQMAANNPMKFDRAICMSGLGSTLSPLDLDEHEALFDATCRYFSIDPHAPDALDQLRKVPEQEMANADHIIQGVPSGNGNPCNDGWFYAFDPQLQSKTEAPSWLQSFMIGDVHDEGVIFTMNVMNETYETVRQTLLESIQNDVYVDRILFEYGITRNTSGPTLVEKVCTIGGEAVFKIQNYLTANVNKRLRQEKAIFKYHFDQRSRLNNALNGPAYHGFDVVYIFGNLNNQLNARERAIRREMASAWVKFAWGQEPWRTEFWKVWGPDSLGRLETEEEDEHVRSYSRFKHLLLWGSDGLWEKYLVGLDRLLMKRGKPRTSRHTPTAGL
jgi:carboxylesterase type B